MQGLKALRHDHTRIENILVVDWGVSNVCNYRCSYCPPRTHRGDFPFVPIERILFFSKRVNEHYRDTLGKEIFFLYTGGEVTLFADFLTLIRKQRSAGNKVGISTNGSPSLDFWKEAKDYLNTVSLSYHEEFTHLDHFINVINILKHSATTHVNIMIRSDRVDKCIEAAYTVFEATDEITIDLQIVLKDFKEPFDYSDDERRKILDACSDLTGKLKLHRQRESYRGNMKMEYDDGLAELIKAGDIITRKMNSWKGWECHIGLEELVVDVNGDILRGWCGQDGIIGNIMDETIHFPTTPFICPIDWCPGGVSDVMVTKTKRMDIDDR
jgi:MoaA/NifB/PqqE/SkfB family radical SAM enzyme